MTTSVSLNRRPLPATGLLAAIAAASLLTASPFQPLAASGAESLASPDGRIQVKVRLPAPGSSERPRWSATFRGEPVLTGCELGLRTGEGGDVMLGAQGIQQRKRSVNERIPVPFGRADHAANRYHEIRYTFEAPRGGLVDVVFRCFDDAIAFRYELPASDRTAAPVTVLEELSSFRLDGDPQAHIQYLPNHLTSHEHNVLTTPAHEIRPGELMDLPLTFSRADGSYVAITEAALRHYAGMALARAPGTDPQPTLVTRLTPRADGSKVVRPLPLNTPWRVVLIGDRPGALLESGTLYALNEPSVIRDTSWIHPGKITFHWWNGDVYDGKPGEPILSFNMAKRYIDFCAANGIPTHSMSSTEGTTDPWYHQSKHGTEPGPDTDVTRPREGFELERIRKYAESKNIRLWTWVHQGALRGRVEEAFTAFEKMGWSGMMVDFFDHDDQGSVEFAEAILESAARHHILIHLHGIWKPTGMERTYPNLMNHEGALNLEYLKWSDRCTPEHNLMMAATRLIAGPMDYHLGGFRAVTRAEFKPRGIAPNVLGTRCHHLAMYVCFDNPNPMVADYPAAYEGQPGFEFLQRVPTWWDETRVLKMTPGELLVTARRSARSLSSSVIASALSIPVPLSA